MQNSRSVKEAFGFILRPLCSYDSDFFLKSEEMCAFFDKRGYPASVVQAGHHRAQLIDQPSALQTSQKELSDFLVRSALQRSDQPGTFKCARTRSKT